MMAAPNRSRITARVEELAEPEAGAPKWYLTVDIVDAVPIEGGLFVQPGDTARVFVLSARNPTSGPTTCSPPRSSTSGVRSGGELQLLPDWRTATSSLRLRGAHRTQFDGGAEGGVE